MIRRRDDNAVTRTSSLMSREQSQHRLPPAEIVALESLREINGRGNLPLTSSQGARVWEEAIQPLTAIVARAEVVRDLIQADELGEVADQLRALEENTQRLLSQIILARKAFATRSRPSA